MNRDDDNMDGMDGNIISIEGHQDKGVKTTQRSSRSRALKDKLRRLNCFKIIDDMVRRGMTVRKIASYIQEEEGELKDYSPDTVRQLIWRYRDDLGEAGVEIATIHDEESSEDAGDPLHELHVLQSMFNLHHERIQMEVNTEKGLSKLFSTTHKEFEVLEKLGSSIIDKKTKLGIIGGDDRKKRTATQFSGRLDMAKFAQRPESRQKVLSMVEAVLGDDEMLEDLATHGGISGMEKMLESGQVIDGELEEVEEPKEIKDTKKKVKKKKAAKKKTTKKKATKKKVAKKKATKKKKAIKKKSGKGDKE